MNPQEIRKAQKTLQLPEQTTPAEIKKQYHTLSKKHHPDQGKQNNQKKMQEINQAYQTLQEYIQNYPINLNPQENKTKHQKHMESFTHDWMWTPGKKQKK